MKYYRVRKKKEIRNEKNARKKEKQVEEEKNRKILLK